MNKNVQQVIVRLVRTSILFAIIWVGISAQAADIDVLFDRLKADFISDAAQNPDSLARVPNDLITMNPDGSWSDIDYASTQVANWPSLEHVIRLGVMAGAYQVSANAYYHDPALIYTVETCTDLVIGSWTNVGYSILGTNVTGGTYNDVTNSVPIVDLQSYIRLKLELQ